LYTDDVRTFDLWSVWSYDGKAAFREMVAECGSLGSDVVAVEFDEIRLEAADEVAAVSAFTTYRALSPEGEELRSMNNRLTWVLRKDGDGAWRIAHEHTSAPAGDEGKVQLRR
jgi:ketosteroid isomerase-like protein